MFGFKSKKEKLEARYKKLLEEAYKLSHVNRTQSDSKTAEADKVRKQIEALEAAE
jgi:polyhydroxyalkanoate synthesis regulator phasin